MTGHAIRVLATLSCVIVMLTAPAAAVAEEGFPALQWIGRDVLQVTPTVYMADARLFVDRNSELLLYLYNTGENQYHWSVYRGGAWHAVPDLGVRPFVYAKTEGSAIMCAATIPARMYSLQEAGWNQIFVGPGDSGGPGDFSVNSNGWAAFTAHQNGQSSSPSIYYRWSPEGGVEALPSFPTDPNYSAGVLPHLDPQNRMVCRLFETLWRYDRTAWEVASAARPAGYGYIKDDAMLFDNQSNIYVPLQKFVNAKDYTFHWFRCDAITGQYTLVHEMPSPLPNEYMSLRQAWLSDNGILTYFALSALTQKAPYHVQVSPAGDVTILEETVAGGIRIENFVANNIGQVLAKVTLPGNTYSEFWMWSDGQWTPLLPGAMTSQVAAFSFDDRAMAYFVFVDAEGKASVAAVPEPASICLLAAGMAALVLRRRSRNVR